MVNLNVMSFNLRFDNPKDGDNAWGHREDEVATVISNLEPAVLGVQEAKYAMIQDLEARLQGYEWIGVGRDGGLEGEFSAVFYQPSLLQPVWAGHFWLSHQSNVPGSRYPGAGCTRMCTWVQFRARGGQDEFLFYNTHLDHASEEARVFGAGLLRDHMISKQGTAPLPAILVGDMNAVPSSAPLHTLCFRSSGEEYLYDAAHWLETQGVKVGSTFHGFKGGTERETIDYILFNQACSVHGYSVFRDKINGRYPSDHYPITAQLTF